jgi:hypothetical protein
MSMVMGSRRSVFPAEEWERAITTLLYFAGSGGCCRPGMTVMEISGAFRVADSKMASCRSRERLPHMSAVAAEEWERAITTLLYFAGPALR